MSVLLENPILELSKNKYDSIPFSQIKLEHFTPAIDEAIKKGSLEVEKISTNTDTPNFSNTIQALDEATELIDHVEGIYFNIMSAESDNKFKELAQSISPKLSRFQNEILLNSKLFDRVSQVYNNKSEFNLDEEESRMIDEKYQMFILNGALLDDTKKESLKKIDEELSKLSPQFSQNQLNSMNEFEYYTTDKTHLEGLPDSALEAANHLAKSKDKKDGWLFSLQMTSMIPILKYAKNRSLRQKFSEAYGKIATDGEFDNSEIIKKIATLRFERATLLGFKNHAEYVLKKRMAEVPERVFEFLDRFYEVSITAAHNDFDELKNLAKETDNVTDFQSWDAAYYSEKLIKLKFDFNSEEFRPYFKMENVLDGAFTVANKMYGLEFNQINDIDTYHKDVKTFEVHDDQQNFIGLLYLDLFPRETKSPGAWMTTYQKQGLFNGQIRRPLVSIVASLTPSTDNKPSLLTFDEVRTIFHEFGHGLHGLLSDCKYRSMSSPDVYWDFVELPSQIMENWLLEKECLDIFATHYETGERIPESLIKKVKDKQKFHSGLFSVRQLSLEYLDMAWHASDPRKINDIEEFETETLEKVQIFPKIPGATISTKFGHIFAGGYSSGYYSYRWARVLDADAFEYFKETGLFNKETATSFRDNILSQGNKQHPMSLYKKFRGREPDPNAELRRTGLI